MCSIDKRPVTVYMFEEEIDSDGSSMGIHKRKEKIDTKICLTSRVSVISATIIFMFSLFSSSRAGCKGF